MKADAPPLDEPFSPEALLYDRKISVGDGPLATSVFNEGNDPPAAARAADKQNKKSDDPYDNYKIKQDDQKAIGDVDSEASQRYEDHAILRMRARREGTFNPSWVDGEGNVIGEDGKSAAAPEGYEKWHNKQVTEILDAGRKNNAINHSTIMTNPMHAQKALAYDVAIGLCYLTPEQLADLRIEADWRLGKGMHDDNPNKKYWDYFDKGVMGGHSLSRWVKDDDEAHRPEKIVDEREGELFLKLGGVA